MQGFARLFTVLGSFFVLATVAYVVWNIAYDAQNLATDPSGGEGRTPIEWVGSVGLLLTAALSFLIAFYLRRSFVAQGGVLPEDRMDAEIDEGDAEQGFFSPWSWWPILLAASLALVFTGIAVGPWVAFVGVPAGFIAIVGWVYQYYRGSFAR